MTEVLELDVLRGPPEREVILRAQGVPSDHQVPESVESLLTSALALYSELAEPRGMVGPIPKAEFLDLYQGEGKNLNPTPLPGIVERAGSLALFSATLGEPVCERIKALFAGNDPALGYMLDCIASERAERAADLLAQSFLEDQIEKGEVDPGAVALPYSPGYCGWHITGQKRLFERLDPGKIGISLNPSCLMLPIKSVSGVLVAGRPDAHVFENDFDFCLDCATWNCRDRIRAWT